MKKWQIKLTLSNKLMLFLIIILLFNITIISVFILKGVRDYQTQILENTLTESSKTANLYIREKFISSKEYTFSKFYIDEGKTLEIELERVLGLDIELYDIDGNSIRDFRKKEEKFSGQDTIIPIAKQDRIAYKRINKKIIYMAPIYDFAKQIGLIRINLDQSDEQVFYNKIRNIVYSVGGISMLVTFFFAYSYLGVILNRIKSLRRSVKSIEEGVYEGLVEINSGDDLEELSYGIIDMADTINANILDLEEEKKKLESALAHLKKLEAKQREFIGNITHEFKTPIAVIKSQIDLMKLYGDDEDLKSNAIYISDTELKHLDNLVEKTLHLARIERYELESNDISIDISKEIVEHIDRIGPKALKYGIEIAHNLKSAMVKMDKENLKYAILNILDNAIKYNNQNGKVVVMGYKANDYYEITITDTGIGIPDKHKKAIFESFYTVDQQRSKRHSSTGLGLSIVKKLVERYDGYISVEDGRDGIGTCFIVGIPCKD